LCDKNRIPLEPDLSVWGSNKCRFVGDIKYKDLDTKGVRSSDMYQVVSYALATGKKEAMLVYAGSDTSDEYRVPSAGMTIRIRSLDITGEPVDVLASVDLLAEEIAEMCEA